MYVLLIKSADPRHQSGRFTTCARGTATWRDPRLFGFQIAKRLRCQQFRGTCGTRRYNSDSRLHARIITGARWWLAWTSQLIDRLARFCGDWRNDRPPTWRMQSLHAMHGTLWSLDSTKTWSSYSILEDKNRVRECRVLWPIYVCRKLQQQLKSGNAVDRRRKMDEKLRSNGGEFYTQLILNPIAFIGEH